MCWGLALGMTQAFCFNYTNMLVSITPCGHNMMHSTREPQCDLVDGYAKVGFRRFYVVYLMFVSGGICVGVH